MRNKRSEVERRLRIMAKARVDMLQGLYKWPDNRPAVKADGTPVLSDRELLRVGGYTPTYRNYKTILFEDPFFLTCVRTEMLRREKAHGLAIRESGSFNRLKSISDLLLDELETRLTTDPSSFTNSQLLAAAKDYAVLAKEVEPPHSAVQKSKMDQFNAFIGSNLLVMNENDRERMVQTASEAADDRIAQLQELIDKATIIEEDADDADIVDAEISPLED